MLDVGRENRNDIPLNGLGWNLFEMLSAIIRTQTVTSRQHGHHKKKTNVSVELVIVFYFFFSLAMIDTFAVIGLSPRTNSGQGRTERQSWLWYRKVTENEHYNNGR